MLNENMDYRNLLIGIPFLLQTVFGILGNFSMLYHYLAIYYNECTLKPVDLILTHLVIANSLIILFNGSSHTMVAFGLRQFFNDFSCRLRLYVYRVGRCVSIASICLLSVFQAITISPRDCVWKNNKIKALKHIRFSLFLSWIVYVVVNLIFPVYVYSKRSIKNITKASDVEYCSSVGWDEIIESLYTALLVFPEILFSVVIIWSSGSMVVILYRHKKLVQYIHSTKVTSRASPVSKATKSILTLVSMFVVFYTLSSILHGCIALLNNPIWWLIKLTTLISMSFPVCCPYVMSCDSTIPRFCFTWIKTNQNLAFF